MQQPLALEVQQPTPSETRPTRKLLATALLALLGLAAAVCLLGSGTIPHATITGALANAVGSRSGNPVAMQPSQPAPASSAVAQPRSSAVAVAVQTPFGTSQTAPPMRTFRVEELPDDPTVDCWLDPDAPWDAKPDYLCTSDLLLMNDVDREDSY